MGGRLLRRIRKDVLAVMAYFRALAHRSDTCTEENNETYYVTN